MALRWSQYISTTRRLSLSSQLPKTLIASQLPKTLIALQRINSSTQSAWSSTCQEAKHPMIRLNNFWLNISNRGRPTSRQLAYTAALLFRSTKSLWRMLQRKSFSQRSQQTSKINHRRPPLPAQIRLRLYSYQLNRGCPQHEMLLKPNRMLQLPPRARRKIRWGELCKSSRLILERSTKSQAARLLISTIMWWESSWAFLSLKTRRRWSSRRYST